MAVRKVPDLLGGARVVAGVDAEDVPVGNPLEPAVEPEPVVDEAKVVVAASPVPTAPAPVVARIDAPASIHWLGFGCSQSIELQAGRLLSSDTWGVGFTDRLAEQGVKFTIIE